MNQPLPSLSAAPHTRLDLSAARRVLVAGDVHGALDTLLAALAAVGFDAAAGDVLILAGDLVDRGPCSAEVVALLDEPGIHAVRGNHEELLLAGYEGDVRAQNIHLANGGMWFALSPARTQRSLAERLARLPYALTIRTPGGRCVGVVHAEPDDDWPAMLASLDAHNPAVRRRAAWARARIRVAQNFGSLNPAAGIDAVYCGHTITAEPFADANVRWIDTGAYRTGRLTIVDVDADSCCNDGGTDERRRALAGADHA